MAPVNPQTVRHHPLPKCLDTNAKAMTLSQLLRSQRWTKIHVVFTNQRQNRLSE
jgi:hypothetical protein